MRIRTQIILATVPVFLLMAVISGGMNYTTQRQELLWGLRERTYGLAYSAAQFIRPGMLGMDPAQASPSPALEQPLQKIVDRNDVKRLSIWDAAGEQLVLTMGKDADPPWPLDPPDAAWLRRHDKPQDKEDPTTTLGSQGMSAYAPIRDASGKRIGVVGVALDASEMELQSRRFLIRIGMVGAGAVLLGIVASLFLGWLITRPVRALGKAATQVADGHYEQHVEGAAVKEIDDLANTFNTMSNVLDDVLNRSKRFLIDSEQFRTQAELAEVYIQPLLKPQVASCARAEVACWVMGRGLSGDFARLVRKDDHLWAIHGHLNQEDSLRRVVAIHAALDFVEDQLTGKEESPDWSFVARLFDMDWLEIIDTTQLTSTTVVAREGTTTCSQREWTLDDNHPLVFHNKEPQFAKEMAVFTDLSEKATAHHMIHEIAKAYENAEEGTLVLMTPRQAGVIDASRETPTKI